PRPSFRSEERFGLRRTKSFAAVVQPACAFAWRSHASPARGVCLLQSSAEPILRCPHVCNKLGVVVLCGLYSCAMKDKSPKARRPHMPGYGLPKTKKGLLSWKWAEDRLRKSRQYWIATTGPEARPHVMVVWALWLNG